MWFARKLQAPWEVRSKEMAPILVRSKKTKYLAFFVSGNEMNAWKLTPAKNIQKLIGARRMKYQRKNDCYGHVEVCRLIRSLCKLFCREVCVELRFEERLVCISTTTYRNNRLSRCLKEVPRAFFSFLDNYPLSLQYVFGRTALFENKIYFCVILQGTSFCSFYSVSSR